MMLNDVVDRDAAPFGKEDGVNIVACVKQVPDTEAQIKVKGDGSGIEEAASSGS
jgi:hypothetical protein